MPNLKFSIGNRSIFSRTWAAPRRREYPVSRFSNPHLYLNRWISFAIREKISGFSEIQCVRAVEGKIPNRQALFNGRSPPCGSILARVSLYFRRGSSPIKKLISHVNNSIGSSEVCDEKPFTFTSAFSRTGFNKICDGEKEKRGLTDGIYSD